jgi:hypothetical protein
VPLGSLILLDIVHQNFQSTTYAAVIEIEAETPDLERLSAAFMLARVDARVENMENLVVAGKQRFVKDLAVPAIERRLDRRRRDHDALVTGIGVASPFLSLSFAWS